MTYTSQYPTQNDDHVKSTSKLNTTYWAYYATDPAKSLTGIWDNNSWLAANQVVTNQRFHIDLGSAKVIKRIYYENAHYQGNAEYLSVGIQNFTFWGSNTGAGTFDDLVWGNDEGWTELTVATNVMLEHIEADQSDPQYIIVTNSTAYRYYAFKFADNNGHSDYMGIRRIELQTEYEAVQKALSGAFSLTGNVIKLLKVSLSGAFNLVGSVARKVLISLSGIFSPTGTIGSIKTIFKSLAGVFDSLGSVSGIKTIFKSLAGVFDLSGGIARKISISLAGSFGFAGGVINLIRKTLSGAFTFTGSIYFKTFWTKITKAIANYTKIDKAESTYTRIDKAESDYTKRYK